MNEMVETRLSAPLSTPSVKGIRTREEAEKVAAEFEAMAIGELLQPMFEALETDGQFGGGAGERAFRPMLVSEYAKAIAAQGGIGIGDAVLKELLRIQGLDPQPPETAQPSQAKAATFKPADPVDEVRG
jgi:peptidoglycan hydrolase FlgJ